LASAALSGTREQDFKEFESFVAKFNKNYGSVEEFEKRFEIFRTFLLIADERNLANGGSVHGVTKFSDLTQEEFKSTYLMKPGFYIPPSNPEVPLPSPPSPNVVLDWRNTKNVVTPVKDQAQCGSCWAFSATEAIESFSALAGTYLKNTTVALSAEQSCSCTYSYNGCDGGNPQNVYKAAVEDHGGEESAADYAYTMNCAKCSVSTTKTKYADAKGYTNAPRNSLQTVLESNGPPSVCVAAESWNSYHGGVMTSCPGSVDHCVQAVGYNTDHNPAYWIVRNSWGVTWGEAGYIYLAMSGDTCQIQSDVNYPHPIPPP
jgi:cysteine peptidase B